MLTEPLFDDRTRSFTRAVDSMVEFLLPAGSGASRSLLVEAVAVLPDGSLLPFGALYCRPSNYTQVYNFVGGPPSLVLATTSHDWRTFKSAPLSEVKRRADGSVDFDGQRYIPAQTRRWGEGMEVELPGPMVGFADHDSCWRDRAMTFPERSVDVYAIKEIRVRRILLKGPAQENFKHPVKDGEWINPNPEGLTGAFAIYTAMMVLADCTSRQRFLEIEVDWRLFREEPEPEQGTPEAENYNFRHQVRDVTPRAPNYWSPLHGKALLEFDAQGNVIRFGKETVAPTAFDRNFVMSAWRLPESEAVYAIDRLGTFLFDGAYLGEKVWVKSEETVFPSLEIPADRMVEEDE